MQMQLKVQPQSDVKAGATEAVARWSLELKIGFRFAFAYFVLVCFPFPIGFLPYTQKPADWYEQVWHWFLPWVGKHLLHLTTPISFTVTGSADTTYGYLVQLCMLILASIAAGLWSVLDRERPNYQKLHAWLRLYVSLTLGSALLSYGAYKVIPSQFRAPWLSHYMETFGESSPMGLLWTFMGASKAYTIFTGSVEMLGGALLFIPRLSTLGALVSIGALGNVSMLNMCYDVPVKLYSFQLLAMSVFLVMPELRRLANVFVFNRTANPCDLSPFIRTKMASPRHGGHAIGAWLMAYGRRFARVLPDSQEFLRRLHREAAAVRLLVGR